MDERDPRRRTQRIVLRHHNDPEGKFTVKQGTCNDWVDKKTGRLVRGCGGTVFRYVTYPNGMGQRFDGPPEVVPGTLQNLGGAMVAEVYLDNMHRATCPMRRSAAVDGKAAGAGVS